MCVRMYVRTVWCPVVLHKHCHHLHSGLSPTRPLVLGLILEFEVSDFLGFVFIELDSDN